MLSQRDTAVRCINTACEMRQLLSCCLALPRLPSPLFSSPPDTDLTHAAQQEQPDLQNLPQFTVLGSCSSTDLFAVTLQGKEKAPWQLFKLCPS